jgi:hypothetical protein
MRWTRRRRRDACSQGGFRERATTRRTDDARGVRQNRVVPTPVAGVKLPVATSIQPDRSAIKPAATEARGIRLRGERGISRQTIAQGMPECSDCTCMLVCTFFAHIRTRDRGCSKHPAFPAPSVSGGEVVGKTRAAMRRDHKLTFSRHHPRMRVIQYSRGSSDRTDKPRRTGSPACAGDDSVGRFGILPSLRAQRSNPRFGKRRSGLLRSARNDDGKAATYPIPHPRHMPFPWRGAKSPGPSAQSRFHRCRSRPCETPFSGRS